MPGTVTDPRIISDAALGIDWQDSEGEAVPGTPFTPAQFIVAKNIDRDPDPTYIKPDGTHGTFFRRKDGTRIVTQAFKKEIEFFGSRHQLLPFIESAMSGQPTSAFVDITLSGTGAANFTDLSLIGIRPYHNTSPFVSTPAAVASLFIDTTESPGFPVTVDFFSDAAKTIPVASAIVAAAATPTAIIAVGGSGLTGSVTLSAAATDVAVAVIDKITFPFQKRFTRFFRLFYGDGEEVVVLSDCAVQQLSYASAEGAELMITAAIMAKRREFFTTVLTIPQTELDLVTYSHSEVTVTKNPVSGPGITPVLDSFEFTIENNVLQYIGNAATPQKIIKRGWTNIGGTFEGEHSDEFAELIADARANTAVDGGFNNFRADFDLIGNKHRLEMKDVRIVLDEPNVAEEEIEKPSLTYEAHSDGVDDPVAVTVEL